MRVLAILCLVAAVLAYSDHPGSCVDPSSSGGDMNVNPTAGTGGWSISGNPTTYTPGSTYQIVVSGTTQMMGFILYAETTNANYRAGVFTTGTNSAIVNYSGDESVGPCPGTAAATIGHNSNTAPFTTITLPWTAPSTGVGAVTFRGVVVQSTQTWYNMATVTSAGPGSPPSTTTTGDATQGLIQSSFMILAAIFSILPLFFFLLINLFLCSLDPVKGSCDRVPQFMN